MAGELASGTWALHSSDKFDDYMKALGVDMATRFIVGKLKPNIEIDVKDETWTIKTLSTFRNTETTFKLNESYPEKTPDGRNVEVINSVDGSKLIRKETGDINTVTTRDFSKDEFTLTLECKDVTCTRVYKRTK